MEREEKNIVSTIKSTSGASFNGQAVPDTLASLDGMISRMQGLKRKLEGLDEESETIFEHSARRIDHLGDLYAIPSLGDVKYDEWSRIRLDRLLVDYLLRNGFVKSARALAKEKDIEELVDLDVFIQCNKIQDSLKRGRTQECLAWCTENKLGLRKLNVCRALHTFQRWMIWWTDNLCQSNLEFELRLQQYIELVRTCVPQKLLEATHHARKHLTPHRDTQSKEIHQAAGLLAFSPDTQAEPYKVSNTRKTPLDDPL